MKQDSVTREVVPLTYSESNTNEYLVPIEVYLVIVYHVKDMVQTQILLWSLCEMGRTDSPGYWICPTL